MRNITIFTLISFFGCSLIATSFLACSPVSFSSAPSALTASCNGSGIACVSRNGTNHFDYTVQTDSAKADVLFVIDNSASMFSIQQAIGSRFASFYNSLLSFDTNIGIITTDISSASNPPRAINGNGAWQDGRLIPFGDGSSFLKSGTANASSLFQNTISRSETLQCEQYIAKNCDQNVGCADQAAYDQSCPSTETRAIFAANLSVQNAPSGFYRNGVPLAIVIVSNADERVWGGQYSMYPMEAKDQPQALVDKVSQTFGGTKPLRVHSIIIRPGDDSCNTKQKFSNTVFGWFGNVYAQLSNLTGGVVGDICSNDYGVQLGNIATSIASQLSSLDLQCAPVNDAVQVTMVPANSVTYSVSGANHTHLQFAAGIPANTSVHLSYDCRN